jgi:hypothetical protein
MAGQANVQELTVLLAIRLGLCSKPRRPTHPPGADLLAWLRD